MLPPDWVEYSPASRAPPFPEVFPERRMGIPGRRFDAHIFHKTLIIPGKFAEIILKPKADRQAGGIGRQAENMEPDAFCKIRFKFLQRLPKADLLQNDAHLFRLGSFVYVREYSGKNFFGFLRGLRIRGVRPKNCRRIADLDAVLAALFQKPV